MAEALKRNALVACHGDGGESERLWGLSAGHVLTDKDVEDIKNLISDYNDEIGNTIELLDNAYQQALLDMAPDKVALVNRVSVLEGKLSCEKALSSFYQRCAEVRAMKQQDTRN